MDILRRETGIDEESVIKRIKEVIQRYVNKLYISLTGLERNMSKERLDVLLVNRGLAESREKAKAIIMSGNVYVEGQKEDKAGQHLLIQLI